SRSDIAENYFRRIEPDSEIERCAALLLPLAVQLSQLLKHFERSLRGEQRVGAIRREGAPMRHDAVADELIHDAVVLENDIGHRLQILVELLEQIDGIGALRQRGETADVGEEDGELFLL